MTSNAPVLKVLIKGFTVMERRLLGGTVKLSERRAPRMELVSEQDPAAADVIMIDAHDAQALQWAAVQPWLTRKAVIWAGAKTSRPEHIVIDRQINWPILPVLLCRALEQVQSTATVAVQQAVAAPGANRRVLIVDDSLAVRNHLKSLLGRQGFDVMDADNAEAGIEAAANELFACVLMDVLMPGIDGFEACRRIKARARNGAALPVIMLTSKASPFDRVRGKMAGCDTYLTKPVDPAQLREVVSRYVTPTAQLLQTASGVPPARVAPPPFTAPFSSNAS